MFTTIKRNYQGGSKKGTPRLSYSGAPESIGYWTHRTVSGTIANLAIGTPLLLSAGLTSATEYSNYSSLLFEYEPETALFKLAQWSEGLSRFEKFDAFRWQKKPEKEFRKMRFVYRDSMPLPESTRVLFASDIRVSKEGIFFKL